ncbi:MAG: hypothetical protein U0835_04550 [Isosphaeraceae bacterium]
MMNALIRWAVPGVLLCLCLPASPALADGPAEPPQIPGTLPPRAPARLSPFQRFALPEPWQERFWAGANARALLKLEPKQVADLLPAQAGVKFCRCPACDVAEADDPLSWSVEDPKKLTCKRCGIKLPNDKFPAHEGSKPPPEDAVEVRQGLIHHYPYHEVEPQQQRYPGERLYLAAKVDHESREFLAKAALYAAVRHREKPDEKLARLACVILVRAAQVYPNYSTHFDQPGAAKMFDKADLAPPYRRGFTTAKWDSSGCLDVPLNLVMAYGLLRDDPALGEAGRLLGVSDPGRLIEHDLFRASARFVLNQPAEVSEQGLTALRGVLAVGRLLDDPVLIREALNGLTRISARGFYYDGFWRAGTLAAHRRVLVQLEGWFQLLLEGVDASSGTGGFEVPMLDLARTAGARVLTEPDSPEFLLASWPAPTARAVPRGPALLGGAGVARLAVGEGADALDVELRSLDAFGPERIVRQALRLGVGGRVVLDDLDESTPLGSGWDRSSLSRNTVLVDGLNQRETLSRAREPAAGGDFLFFAADPDFQVVTLDDPRSYPRLATRYRQTVVASAGARSRFALSVFEVHGGVQHDQVFHAPRDGRASWRLSVPTSAGPNSLLPNGLSFVPGGRAEDGRWFVQAFGELAPEARATVERPATATWFEQGPAGVRPGVRMHLLGDLPMEAVTAKGPDDSGNGRPALVLRRRTRQDSGLVTRFVTLFEPASTAVPPLSVVKRLPSPDGTVIVAVGTADGPEHVVVNFTPGTPCTVRLSDGRTLTTDGLAVRVSATGLVLAGGVWPRSAAAAGLLRSARPPWPARSWLRRGGRPSGAGGGSRQTPCPTPTASPGGRSSSPTTDVPHAPGRSSTSRTPRTARGCSFARRSGSRSTLRPGSRPTRSFRACRPPARTAFVSAAWQEFRLRERFLVSRRKMIGGCGLWRSSPALSKKSWIFFANA